MLLRGDKIEQMLLSHPATKEYFIGVYPADQMPSNYPIPCCFVANTDPANLPGQHWIAINCPINGSVEYFDSFGEPPTRFPLINKWLKATGQDIKSNKKRVQEYFTVTCSAHVVVFLIFRYCGKTMHQITTMFSDPFTFDGFVTEFVKKQFSLKQFNVIDDRTYNEQVSSVFGN